MLLSRRKRTVSTGHAAYVFGRTRSYGRKGIDVGARRVTARAVLLVASSIRGPGRAHREDSQYLPAAAAGGVLPTTVATRNTPRRATSAMTFTTKVRT